MDTFWFVAGACVGALTVIFAVLGLTLWSLCKVSSDTERGWSPSEFSTEDDAGRMIVVGDDPWTV